MSERYNARRLRREWEARVASGEKPRDPRQNEIEHAGRVRETPRAPDGRWISARRPAVQPRRAVARLPRLLDAEESAVSWRQIKEIT